jgi:hypothetical protein
MSAGAKPLAFERSKARGGRYRFFGHDRAPAQRSDCPVGVAPSEILCLSHYAARISVFDIAMRAARSVKSGY